MRVREYSVHATLVIESGSMENADALLADALDLPEIAVASWTTVEIAADLSPAKEPGSPA